MKTDSAPSIATRVHQAVFAISLVSLLIAVAAVFYAYTDLERSMLALDLEAERDFVLEHTQHDRPLQWDTASLKALYVPDDLVDQHPLPEVFRDLPYPFSGEIEHGGRTFLATLGHVQGGRLYLARDISLFEQRERMFALVLAAICVAVLVLSFVLARLSSRRVVTPLQQLANHLRRTTPGRRMPRIKERFEDVELRAIAETFNRFLDELEAFVKREQSLLSLASHELRTPIAVISGGLEVMESRSQLAPSDRKTLQRVQHAAAEMQANVDVVLKLARRKEHAEQVARVRLPEMVHELLEELTSPSRSVQHVHLKVSGSPSVEADPVLVKMLLRNLIQNALQHTTGKVWIRLAPGRIEITDQGAGLPESYQRLLLGEPLSRDQVATLPGLGLFIVTLICERLGWELSLAGSSEQGTTLCLRLGAHGTGSSN